MRILAIFTTLVLSGCAGQIQWGVPSEQKIQAQLAPLQEALQQHAQAINNQAKALDELYSSEDVKQPTKKDKS